MKTTIGDVLTEQTWHRGRGSVDANGHQVIDRTRQRAVRRSLSDALHEAVDRRGGDVLDRARTMRALHAACYRRTGVGFPEAAFNTNPQTTWAAVAELLAEIGEGPTAG